MAVTASARRHFLTLLGLSAVSVSCGTAASGTPAAKDRTRTLRYNASQFTFAIPRMYAGIITVSAIGVIFNQLLVTVERRLSSCHVPAGN